MEGLTQAKGQHMSIRVDDSGITTIAHVTLDALWVRAEQLLQLGNVVTASTEVPLPSAPLPEFQWVSW